MKKIILLFMCLTLVAAVGGCAKDNDAALLSEIESGLY